MPSEVPAAATVTSTALFVSLLLNVAAAVLAELQQRTPTPSELGPPRELGPVPPPDDAPLLRGAGARRLAFFVRYDCPDMHCPSTVFWRYRKLEVEVWIPAELSHTYEGKDHFNSTTTFSNLSVDTWYEIQALPVKENKNNSGQARHPLWYFPSFSHLPVSKALTCSQEVSSVRDLLVHSAGRGWLALSWLPPTPTCSTFLDYSMRYTTSSSDSNGAQVHATHWRWVGRFWTEEKSRTEGRVIPCAAWPGRHCLLIAHQLQPNQTYSVQIQVERRIDEKNSQPQEAQGWTRDDIAPGAPEKLLCQALGPRMVIASWSPPLRPGGRLEEAHLLLRGEDDVRTFHISVTLRQEYVFKVKDLRPNTSYDVGVRFVTASKKEGALANARVTTEHDEDFDTDSGSGLSKPSMSLQSPPPPQSPQTATNASDAYLWLAGVLVALLLLPIAFAIGCRSGRKWAASTLQEQKLVKISEEKCDGVASGNHKEEQNYYYATSTDLASPPRSPPPTGAAPPIPAPVLVVPPEYAEPHVSPLEGNGSNFPWDAYAYPCSEDTAYPSYMRASWQSSHHYEDLEATKMSEQETLYSDAASISPYAEVGLPSMMPPPIKIANLYAQVNKPHPRPQLPLKL